jgi:hypothetical protein
MSNRNNINRNKKIANMGVNTRRSCKHCKNLGKSEREYTSHWTRASMSPDAPIICPEILKMECAYCHGIGHMASEVHCPLLKSLKKEETKRELEEARRAKSATFSERAVRSTAVAAQKRLSSFSLIAEESSSDSEEETSNNKTYAMAVKLEQRSADVPTAADSFTVFGIAPKKYRNWADDSSDSEDD